MSEFEISQMWSYICWLSLACTCLYKWFPLKILHRCVRLQFSGIYSQANNKIWCPVSTSRFFFEIVLGHELQRRFEVNQWDVSCVSVEEKRGQRGKPKCLSCRLKKDRPTCFCSLSCFLFAAVENYLCAFEFWVSVASISVWTAHHFTSFSSWYSNMCSKNLNANICSMKEKSWYMSTRT